MSTISLTDRVTKNYTVAKVTMIAPILSWAESRGAPQPDLTTLIHVGASRVMWQRLRPRVFNELLADTVHADLLALTLQALGTCNLGLRAEKLQMRFIHLFSSLCSIL